MNHVVLRGLGVALVVATAVACSPGDSSPEPTGEATIWYRDADGDGFGDPDNTVQAVDAPAGYVAQAGDCDDTNAGVYIGAAELEGDGGLDADCDGEDD